MSNLVLPQALRSAGIGQGARMQIPDTREHAQNGCRIREALGFVEFTHRAVSYKVVSQ